MNLKERIQELCRQNGISMNKVETDLGFGKGYISKLGKSTPNAIKIQQIADYFDVSVDYLMAGQEEPENAGYYLNQETAKIAQKIFENKDLKVLFDAAEDASPEDLKTTHDMLMALKKKERGTFDD